MPAVRLKTQGHIFREGQTGLAAQRDVVMVIKANESSQLEVAGERSRLCRDPFHEIPVARQDIGIVIDDFIIRAIEPGGEKAFGNGHTHAIGKPLAQGSGGALYAGGMSVFRVPGSPALPLAELLEFFDGQRIAGEVEESIEESGAMAGREHETVAIRPSRILGMMFQEFCPEKVSHGRGPHGHSRVAGVSFLDHIHGQHADGVDTKLIYIHAVSPFRSALTSVLFYSNLVTCTPMKAIFVRYSASGIFLTLPPLFLDPPA